MKTAIITGSNKFYFDKLLLLCKSLKFSKVLELNNVDLCILDIDFTKEQLSILKNYTNKFKTPSWDFEFKFKTQDWKKLLTVRPFLRDYFTGYDNYVWLDADTVVLDENFISYFNNALNFRGLNIVPEMDNYYITKKKDKTFRKIFRNIFYINGWVYKNNLKYFGKEFATRCLGKPLFNAGIYSLKSNSIIWDQWKVEYKKVIDKANNDYCLNMDQASLNKVVYENFDEVNVFDAKYNWLIKNKLPVLDNNFEFYKNEFSNEKISILHFTQVNPSEKFKFYKFKNQEYLDCSFEEIFEKKNF